MVKSRPQHSVRNLLILIGAIQGALLLLAHELIARKIAPGTSLAAMSAWYTAVIGAPAAMQLLLIAPRDRRLWRYAAALGLVLAAVGAYFGWMLDPPHSGGFYFLFALTMLIAWFVALPFAAIWMQTGGWRFAYPDLFTHAWNNALTLVIAGLFTGTFWLLLWLWAALFNVIGIEFFSKLFQERAFIYVATATAFGLAVSLGRTYEGAVVTVRNVVLSVYRMLLPLLAGIALLFLLALPFTGLQPLWNTGHAAALLLTLQLLFILFLNASYQDGQGQAPYAPWLRRGIELTAVVLPIYSLLALYAIGLRVHQYGWSDDRVWAALIAAIASCYSFGYAAAALVRRPRWLAWVGPVNVVMAGVVIVVMVLANSPLLDPKRIAVHSQVQRLLNGTVDANAFDYNYLRFHAGKPGVDGLSKLAELTAHPQAQDISAKAKGALAMNNSWDLNAAVSPADVASRIDLLPPGKKLDPSFVAFVLENKSLGNLYCYRHRDPCAMLAVDLNRDGREEYLMLESPHAIFSFQGGRWKQIGTLSSNSARYLSVKDLKARRDGGLYKLMPHKWPNIQIGDNLYVVVEGER